MRLAISFVALSTLLLMEGCSRGQDPAAPTTDRVFMATAPTQTACAFSAIAKPARVYAFAESSLPAARYTRCSRFVLYDNGTFELQFGSSGTYSGMYRESNTVVDFKWDGWSVAGPWGSDATLDGDTLTVHYNTIMWLSDFEDAVYRLSR